MEEMLKEELLNQQKQNLSDKHYATFWSFQMEKYIQAIMTPHAANNWVGVTSKKCKAYEQFFNIFNDPHTIPSIHQVKKDYNFKIHKGVIFSGVLKKFITSMSSLSDESMSSLSDEDNTKLTDDDDSLWKARKQKMQQKEYNFNRPTSELRDSVLKCLHDFVQKHKTNPPICKPK